MWDYQFRFWISELLFSSINLYGGRGASFSGNTDRGIYLTSKARHLAAGDDAVYGYPRFYSDVAAGRYVDEIDEPVDDTIWCGGIGLCI